MEGDIRKLKFQEKVNTILARWQVADSPLHSEGEGAGGGIIPSSLLLGP
jgi:hypothetical protein